MTTPAPELRPLPVVCDGVGYSLFARADKPLARDLEVAGWLGYENPYNIRRLIRERQDDLGEVFSLEEKTPSPLGGRPGTTYYLTEEQVLFLAAKSETPNAVAVLKQMIAVFLAAKRGLLQPTLDPERFARLEAQVAELKARRPMEQLALNLQRKATAAAKRGCHLEAEAFLVRALADGRRPATELAAAAEAAYVPWVERREGHETRLRVDGPSPGEYVAGLDPKPTKTDSSDLEHPVDIGPTRARRARPVPCPPRMETAIAHPGARSSAG